MPLTGLPAMVVTSIGQGGKAVNMYRIIGWGAAAVLLALPAVAMRFTEEVNWTASDFALMGALLGSMGLAFELLMRASGSLAYRLGGALAILTAFLTVWVNLAVGMIGDGPYNLLFGGVIAIALFGAVLANFRANEMAITMAVAAIVQAALSGFGMLSDARGGLLSMAFALLWLLSAALFRSAGRETRENPN